VLCFSNEFEIPMFKLFEILNFGYWNLPFDLAQGGEPVEPFVICLPAIVLAGCL